MYILTWNIRGIHSSKARLRHILNKHCPLVVALLELFLSANKCPRWARWLHLPNFCHNIDAGGKIWLFWVDRIDFQLISAMDQAVSGWFSYGNDRVFATFVYASCFQWQHGILWQYLCDAEVDGCPWFLGGDFNIICSETEKIGGVFRSLRAIREFNNCIQECGLLDLPVDSGSLGVMGARGWTDGIFN